MQNNKKALHLYQQQKIIEMEVTVNYEGVDFKVEGSYTPKEVSHDPLNDDTPSHFEVEAIWIEDLAGDIEPMLTEEAKAEITRLAEEEADNNY